MPTGWPTPFRRDGAGPSRPRKPRPLRVVELLRKAIEWRRGLDAGAVSNQAAIARREGITHARMTQVMGLLRLAPEIQKHVLAHPATAGRPAISERALRPIAQLEDQANQMARFVELIEQAE